jgi:hypothetical protein
VILVTPRASARTEIAGVPGSIPAVASHKVLSRLAMWSLNDLVRLESETVWLKRHIQRLRDARRLVSDERAADAIDDLIAEVEARLDQITGAVMRS